MTLWRGQAKEIQLVLELTNSLEENFYIARRAAIDFAIPLVTNVEQVPPSSAPASFPHPYAGFRIIAGHAATGPDTPGFSPLSILCLVWR
jgi:hypothetical protein